MKIQANKITVRWWDGFKRTYSIKEFESGSDYLWIMLSDGHEKWIPTRGVRWFSPEKSIALPDIQTLISQYNDGR